MSHSIQNIQLHLFLTFFSLYGVYNALVDRDFPPTPCVSVPSHKLVHFCIFLATVVTHCTADITLCLEDESRRAFSDKERDEQSFPFPMFWNSIGTAQTRITRTALLQGVNRLLLSPARWVTFKLLFFCLHKTGSYQWWYGSSTGRGNENGSNFASSHLLVVSSAQVPQLLW